MTLKDASLLGRKILLGIIISIIPLVITVGGLTFIRKVFTYHDVKRMLLLQTLKTQKNETGRTC